jgi:hypothetical protein
LLWIKESQPARRFDSNQNSTTARPPLPAAPAKRVSWRISRIDDPIEMSVDRAGKAFTNERKYPFIVEVPVAANGLDVELSRQISGFHKSHRIPPRFGRTVFRDGQSYYRWCFSDLATARAFVEEFGGAFYKTTGT